MTSHDRHEPDKGTETRKAAATEPPAVPPVAPTAAPPAAVAPELPASPAAVAPEIAPPAPAQVVTPDTAVPAQPQRFDDAALRSTASDIATQARAAAKANKWIISPDPTALVNVRLRGGLRVDAAIFKAKVINSTANYLNFIASELVKYNDPVLNNLVADELARLDNLARGNKNEIFTNNIGEIFRLPDGAHPNDAYLRNRAIRLITELERRLGDLYKELYKGRDKAGKAAAGAKTRITIADLYESIRQKPLASMPQIDNVAYDVIAEAFRLMDPDSADSIPVLRRSGFMRVLERWLSDHGLTHEQVAAVTGVSSTPASVAEPPAQPAVDVSPKPAPESAPEPGFQRMTGVEVPADLKPLSDKTLTNIKTSLDLGTHDNYINDIRVRSFTNVRKSRSFNIDVLTAIMARARSKGVVITPETLRSDLEFIRRQPLYRELLKFANSSDLLDKYIEGISDLVVERHREAGTLQAHDRHEPDKGTETTTVSSLMKSGNSSRQT